MRPPTLSEVPWVASSRAWGGRPTASGWPRSAPRCKGRCTARSMTTSTVESLRLVGFRVSANAGRIESVVMSPNDIRDRSLLLRPLLILSVCFPCQSRASNQARAQRDLAAGDLQGKCRVFMAASDRRREQPTLGQLLEVIGHLGADGSGRRESRLDHLRPLTRNADGKFE